MTRDDKLNGLEHYERFLEAQRFDLTVQEQDLFHKALRRSVRPVITSKEPAAPMTRDKTTNPGAIAAVAGERQERILAWAVETFGSVADNRHERAMRFIEEAIELAQSCGLSRETIAAITERAYSRRAGTLDRELAQAGMTLESLAANVGFNLSGLIDDEFNRVREMPKEEWARRHAAKTAIGITADATPTEGAVVDETLYEELKLAIYKNVPREATQDGRIGELIAIKAIEATSPILSRLSAAREEAEREQDEFKSAYRQAWKWAAGDREKERESARAEALEEAAKWHDQRRRDTPDAFEMEFHEVSAKAIRALKPVQGEQ